MPNGNSQKERITALEVNLQALRSDVLEIKEHDLVHIATRIERIEKYLYMGLGALALLEIWLTYSR